MLPEADYEFYRIIGTREEGACEHPELLQTMYTAWVNGVDILNISGGYEAPEGRELPSEREITKFAEDGLTTVSALGNYIENNVEDATFPAKHPDVIGVAGYEPSCNCSVNIGVGDETRHRYAFGPKSADEFSAGSNIYCGYQSYRDNMCNASDECSLTETAWDGNVTEGAVPDIYAPFRYPVDDGNNINRKSGTSYATPLVVAALGAALDCAKQAGRPVSPAELQFQIKETGSPLTAADGHKPDAANLRTAILPDNSPVPSFE